MNKSSVSESQSVIAVGLTCIYAYREEAIQYGSGDIAEGLNDSTLNDSQANTTVEGEITQDSVQMLVYYCWPLPLIINCTENIHCMLCTFTYRKYYKGI